jgi:hypothetical protein
MKHPQGICHVCACVDHEACDDGCEWADRTHTLCSACNELSDEERIEKRQFNLEYLANRLSCVTDEALELKHRLRVLEKPLPGKRKPQKTTRAQHPRYPRMKAVK